MTEAMYLADGESAYRRTFRSEVVARPPGGVVLASTCFYPMGGGQPADHGWLVGTSGGRWRVIDVRTQGRVILHEIGRDPGGRPPPVLGESVEGTIDWDRRYAHMRAHTAQHLVSALIFARTGRTTVAARLSAGSATVDLDGPWPTSPDWDRFAAEVLEETARSRPVRISFVPRAEWALRPTGRSSGLRVPLRIDPVRVIEIDGVDACPCGGTHLRSTGEIGPIDLDAPRAQGAGVRVGLRLRGVSAHSDRVTP